MTKAIPISRGMTALIDDEDYEAVSKHKWNAVKFRNVFYAITSAEGKPLLLHRLITQAPKGAQVDHANGDGLDNRRENLRICTHADNMRNRRMQKNNKTGYRGVTVKGKKYRACLSLNNKTIHIGVFADPKDAAKAYDEKAQELYGEFARTNF